MTLAQNTNTNLYAAKKSERKRSDYGFILALLAVAVALVIVSAMARVPIDNGSDGLTTFVGP